MITRFTPIVMLGLAVTQPAVLAGCPTASHLETPLPSPSPAAAKRATVVLGEPTIVSLPATRAATLHEMESLPRNAGLLAARMALVRHYLANNDGAKAHLHADELVRQHPLDPTMRQLLGRALMQERMWREAIAAFRLVVTDEPDNIFAHNNIGYSAIQIGELALAREHLERTLSLEPQQGYMLNNLGVTYERLGRAAEAHAAFARAAELSPRYLQAKLNRDRLQAGLTQDERIVSSETLLHLREPAIVDGAVPFASASESGGDLINEAMDAASGGSARMAPAGDSPE